MKYECSRDCFRVNNTISYTEPIPVVQTKYNPKTMHNFEAELIEILSLTSVPRVSEYQLPKTEFATSANDAKKTPLSCRTGHN
jgi:hypothetical protein